MSDRKQIGVKLRVELIEALDAEAAKRTTVARKVTRTDLLEQGAELILGLRPLPPVQPVVASHGGRVVRSSEVRRSGPIPKKGSK